jgi:hypothetical protein
MRMRLSILSIFSNMVGLMALAIMKMNRRCRKIEGEFYYIRFKLPEHIGGSAGLEGAYSSFEEAVQRVVIATSGTVTWKE